MALGFLGKPKGRPEAESPRSLELLDDAIVQRSKFHLALDALVTGIADLSASLIRADDRGLVLELSGVRNIPPSWHGGFMDCFFKLSDKADPNRKRYFQFSARIESSFVKDGVAYVRAGLPEKIVPGQRRKSLRVRAELRRFAHLAMWTYESSTPFDVKNPLASFEHFQRGLSVVENLSAGGARLTLKSALLKEKGLVPKAGDRFILHILLANAAPPMDRPFWIIARVNNALPDFTTKDVSLGLEFAAEGSPEAATGKVRWKKVEDNMIERLGQATYLWHVEFYREKGFIDL